MGEQIKQRVETETEVKAYIQNMKYALSHGAKLIFQIRRLVDENKQERYTNQYTVNALFGEENPETTVFVMSFHFAERAFMDDMFPYKKDKGGVAKI